MARALLLAVTVIFTACDETPVVPPSPTFAATPSPTSTALVRYDDPVVGISFIAPRGLLVVPAQPGVDGQTSQAIFRTYSEPPPGQPIDLGNELSIGAWIATRKTNEDLRALVARGFPGSYTITSLPGRDGLLLDGDGQAGPRRFAVIAHGPDHVLILSAYPPFSSRIALFDQLLATLEVR